MAEVTFNFSDKNFVAVGASSGMGRQIALELAEAGANVLAIALNQKNLQAVKDQYPDRIDCTVLDVTKASLDDWERVLGEFVNAHGKINGGVYSAGTSVLTPLRSFDEDAARNIMETGYWGAIKCLRSMTRKKFAMPGSSYVLFSSIAGHTGLKGSAIYSSTKAAVRLSAYSFSAELERDRHRLNTISPGWVRTNLTKNTIAEGVDEADIGRDYILGLGEPSDVSGMVLFLLSDRAKWITGEDFIVDGGALRGGL